MSKPKIVVLAFLHRAPMYGYQISHIAEEIGLPVWASIKLPSIYKALQDLEKSGHIRGEQVTEGNTPPRTVFHINDAGKELLGQLVCQSLTSADTLSNDWWLALSLSWKSVTHEFLEKTVQSRLDRFNGKWSRMKDNNCNPYLDAESQPFVIDHVWKLGKRHHEVEVQSLQELLEDIRSGKHKDYYCNKINQGEGN